MTEIPASRSARTRTNLPIDQRLALRGAVTHLGREFAEMLGADTVELFLYSSYNDLADRATVTNFLPLLAERFARQRLRALAKVEGKIIETKPTVLFVCPHNAGRSQMALGFFARMAGDQAIAWSGGSEPGAAINPAAVAAMAEVDIDITGDFPKPWTDELVRAADVIVTLGCGDRPVFPGHRYQEWPVNDTAGEDLETVRPIRDQIEVRVRKLLTELDIPVPY